MNEKLTDDLKTIAERRCWHDDLNDPEEYICVDNFAGGNVDDAYEGGLHAGKTLLARNILTQLGVEFTIEDE